jgi:hypothetical protein
MGDVAMDAPKFFENRILTDLIAPPEVYPFMWGQIGNLSAGWPQANPLSDRADFAW